VSDPFVTPDNKRVLYTWFKDEAGELRIANLDGTGMRPLTRRGEYVAYEVGGIRADGKLAAVNLGRGGTWQIDLLSLETGKRKTLKNLGWRDTYVGNFSPDGRWLVFSAQLKNGNPDKAVYVIATDGSAEHIVVPSVRGNDPPRFTPDGARVLFTSRQSAHSDLWSVKVNDGKAAAAPEIVKLNVGSGLGFSPDGTFYYSEFEFSTSEFVVHVDPSTWKPKNAPVRISDPFRNESVQAPYWSLDGRRLAYQANAVEDRLVIHDFDSSQDRELSTHAGKGSLRLVGWFADGKSLQVAAPPDAFRLVDPETQQVRRIALAGAIQSVASVDGKAVFYATIDSVPCSGKEPMPNTMRVIRRSLETDADKELYCAEAKPQGLFLAPSPDGRSLAFAFMRPGDDWPRLWIMPSSGGEPRELIRNERALWSNSWTQDSRAILFVRSGEIWVKPIDGHESYATGITFSDLSAPNVSPDGSRLAFRGNTTTENVWMIRNLFPETSTAKH
jgi:Tol biopolymer transport system component